MMELLTDENLQETVDLYIQYGSQRKIAEILGLSQSTINYRIKMAAQRGLLGTSPVLPGYVIARSSEQRDEDGNLQKEWITQKPAHAEEWQMPPQHVIKGVSALVDANGNVIQQWVKTRQTMEDKVEYIKNAFDDLRPAAPVAAPSHVDSTLLTIYPVADLHLGMYAWDEETGENYDLYIAQDLLNDAVGQLVELSPGSETSLVLGMGDFFHSDSNENRTRRSGNPLDVDTRYAKVLKVGLALMVGVVIRALEKHKHVIFRNLPGNHDPYAALALTLAISAYFRDEPRVTVDTSPSPFFFHRHGKVLIGATHGDMVKAEDMPGLMAATVPVEWGRSQFRYVYCGHWHSKRKRLISENSGAEVEVFQTLAPRDAWGNAMGFTANRSMVAITHHAEYGEVTRMTQTVRSK